MLNYQVVNGEIISSTNHLNQAQLLKRLSVMPKVEDAITADDFMQLLAELYWNQVVLLTEEFYNFIRNRGNSWMFSHRGWRGRFSYTFSDGVYIDNTTLVRKVLSLNINILANKPQVCVKVVDHRFNYGLRNRGDIIRFEQKLRIPYEFHQLLLLKDTKGKGLGRNCTYDKLVRYVSKSLGNRKLHELDRVRKFDALIK